MEVIEITELNLNSSNHAFCCVCLNTSDYKFIKLKCCNQEIHKKCVIEWITSPQNRIINCPICRKQMDISFSNFVTLGEIIDEVNKKDKLLSKQKFDQIIQTLYPDSYLNTIITNPDDEIDFELSPPRNTHVQFIFNTLFIMFMLFVFGGYFYMFFGIKN